MMLGFFLCVLRRVRICVCAFIYECKYSFIDGVFGYDMWHIELSVVVIYNLPIRQICIPLYLNRAAINMRLGRT